jgi:hypothetical protein
MNIVIDGPVLFKKLEHAIQLVPFIERRNAQEYRSGEKWYVFFDGKLLLEASRNPEIEACRALVALGLAGKLTTYRNGICVHSGLWPPALNVKIFSKRFVAADDFSDTLHKPSGHGV